MRSMDEGAGDAGSWGERVSDVVDGRASAEDLEALLTQARVDPAVFGTWHCYQVIGDVLRSDDLASACRDRQFVRRLREKMGVEPLTLAPQAVPSGLGPGARRPRAAIAWAAACVLAVTAGFLGLQQTWNGDSSVARAPGLPAAVVSAQGGAGAARADGGFVEESDALQLVVTPSGQMIRDSALDQYLQAHRRAGSASALPLPAGDVRNASDVR